MTDFYRKASLIAVSTLGALKFGEKLGECYAERFSKKWSHHFRTSSTHNEIAIYEKPYSINSHSCVLMVHGIGNSSVSLVRFGDEVVKTTGLPVIRYDRPGYGSSRFCTDEPYSVTQSVNELVELILWLHDRYGQVLVTGYSYGGLLAYLAFMELKEPEWCKTVLIEPLHLQEVVVDPSRKLGVTLGLESLRSRQLLSLFGGELLDASIGPFSSNGGRYPFIDAVRRERRSGRCVRATRREFNTLSQILLNGTIVEPPQASSSIRVVTSAESMKQPKQHDLFADFVCSNEDLMAIEETSHDTIIFDRHSVTRIAQLIKNVLSNDS